MEEPWFILSKRYGGDIREPSVEEMRAALSEVYVETHPNLTQADYEEHPSAFVRYGTDSGPMYVLYIGRTKTATFEQWADQDFGDELAEPLSIEDVSLEAAIAMCSQLQKGQVDALRKTFQLHGK
ncbi:hypothetical protein ACVNIS_01830 [Sphaerotilaceae bacterium SBD11-9]